MLGFGTPIRLLCYDSPPSIGFTPSVFVDITTTLDKKVDALRQHASQVDHSVMASVDVARTSGASGGCWRVRSRS